jgi:alpha-tubulin suppressor-like RCC1 family protein
VTTAHSVLCWGNGTSGNLGNGAPPMSSFMPVPVAGISDANLVVTGAVHACELSASKQVRCWGSNETGSIGADLATKEFDSPAPVVPGIADVSSLAAGNNHTCAVVAAGSVRCWGYNADGELGTTPILTKPFGTPSPATVSAW